MKEIAAEVRRVPVFGEHLYYVWCHQCGSWVKSGTGQYVWATWKRAAENKKAHLTRGHPRKLTRAPQLFV